MEKVISIVSKRKLKTKKTGKTYVGFTDTDDERYSVFDPKFFDLIKEGETVKLIGEQGEEYFNIEDITPQITEQPTRRSEDTNKSIQAQVAAKAVTELWIAGKLENENSEVKALRNWLCQQLGANYLVEEAKKLGAVPKTDTIVPEMGTEEIPEFKNAGNFLMKVYDEFKLTKTQAMKILEVEDTQEIKNFKRAWGVLLEHIDKKKKEKSLLTVIGGATKIEP